VIADEPPRRVTVASGTLVPQPAASFDTVVSLWNSPSGAAQAGGDWCDAFAVSESCAALTIGDVSGHGSGVAGTMAAIRAAILGAIDDRIAVPSEILAIANDAACGYAEGEGVIVTAIVAFLDHRLETLTFANAGHPPPLMLTAQGDAFLQHSPADLPLGVIPSYRGADYVVAMPSDALIVFYTDGITEHQRDPVFGEAELIQASRLVHGRPKLNAARAIARRVFHRSRGSDDAAAIVLRTQPQSPARAGQ
jgi:serine phosphatase RsbU (regulator of sigma subunit)